MNVNSKTLVNLMYFVSFLATFIFYSNIVLFHLNPYFFDLSGHFASALFFKQGLFHQYNHYNLGGYIQGLFYPPLQDILINFFNLFMDFYTACRVYLILIFLVFLLSLYFFSQSFKRQLSRVLFLFFILTIIFLEKVNNLAFLQGISIGDTLFVGFSAQMLSFSLFLLCIRSMFFGKFGYSTILFLFLIFISHIVVSIVAVLIFLIYALISKDIRKIKFMILPLLMSSFFIIPFVFYSYYINSSAVSVQIHPENIIFFMLSLMVLCFFIKRIKEEYLQKNALITIWSFCAFVGAVVSFSELLNFLKIRSPIPFHFYRFDFFLFFLFFVAALLTVEFIQNKKKYYVSLFFLIFLFVGILLFYKMHFISKEFVDNYFNEVKLVSISPNKVIQDETNNFAFTSQSSLPFNQFRNFQELLRLNGNKFKSVQGVYWESNFSTNILDSYTATLFGNVGDVTDRIELSFSYCSEYRIALDFFIKDFSIKYIVLDNDYFHKPNVLPENTEGCLNMVLEKGGTEYFEFTKNGNIEFSISDNLYKKYIYRIESKNNDFSNSMAEYMFNEVEIVNPKESFWFNSYFENKINSIKNIYISYKEFVLENNLNYTPSEKNNSKIQFTALSSGKYKIYAPVEGTIKIKLNYMPGLNVYDDKNNKIAINRGFNFFYFYGKGSYVIEYTRPWIYYFSYAISFISIIAFIGIYFVKKLRTHG